MAEVLIVLAITFAIGTAAIGLIALFYDGGKND